MRTRSFLRRGTLICPLLLTGIVFAASNWQKDPGQWTSEDVYQILNDSPWSKSVTVVVARQLSDGGRGEGGGTWGEGVPGGQGRGTWGGLGTGGMGGGGMGRGRRGYPSEEGPTVTIRWGSSLPVRLAEAKSAGGAVDEAALKPMDHYVIAVIGLPKSGFEPKNSDRDSAPSDDALIDHLKTVTVLAYGHQRIGPDKIELNQGRDGRTVFYFDKSDPITMHDKDVEFRITGDHMEVRKKFALKDMQYEGKLDL